MKKYILIVAIISTLTIACHQPATQTTTTTTTATTAENAIAKDSLKKPLDAPPMEMLQVSNLSAEELKDDSVFADGSRPASWQNAGITNVKGLKLFIKQLQQWIVMNEKDSLASVVKYPLNKKVKTKADLVASYDALFTKDVKLSFATINFSQLFRNVEGVMTSGGKVWIAQQGKAFKIIAINP